MVLGNFRKLGLTICAFVVFHKILLVMVWNALGFLGVIPLEGKLMVDD